MENKTNDKNNIEEFFGKCHFLKMIRRMCLKKAEDD